VQGNRAAAEEVCRTLENVAGITAIKANPLTGSVTITYDSGATDEHAVCRMLQEQGYFDRAFRLAAGERPPRRRRHPRTHLVDFAQFQVAFTNEPDVTRIVWLASLVLGSSRWLWARFVLHQDLQTVLRCHPRSPISAACRKRSFTTG
jgi:hypothetical protein